MKGRNCPNCGAVLQSDVCKCPYCGTSYFDFCAMDIEDGKPFYLKFRHEWNGKPVEVTALVRLEPGLSIEHHYNTVDCGKFTYKTSSECIVNMNFMVLPDDDDTLIKMTVYEED